MGKKKTITSKKAGEKQPNVIYVQAPSQAPQQQSWQTQALDTSAQVGKTLSYFQLAGQIFIGIICLSIGVYLLFRKHTYDSVTTGSVTSVKNGIVGVQFIVNGKQYNVNYSSTGNTNGNQNTSYNVGQTVTIRYSSSNPSNFSIGDPPLKLIGVGLIFLALCLIIGGSIWFYFVQKNKYVAAFSGVTDVVGAVREI